MKKLSNKMFQFNNTNLFGFTVARKMYKKNFRLDDTPRNDSKLV
jgi:hypothetical protein